MNFQQLQALVAAVDGGSFQAAAERLHLTQSAVSMQIKALEGELGTTLFDRTVRPPAPSVAGRAAATRARALLAEAEALKRAAAEPGSLAGTLHLGTIPTAATDFLPDALAALSAAHPNLQARVESGLTDALLARVVTGELDAALVTDSGEAPAAIRLLPLRTEALVTVGAKDRGPPVLEGRPFIRFNRATGVGRVIDRRLRADGVGVADAMELDSIEAILMMVSRGLGVAVVPETSLRGPLADTLATAPFGAPPVTRRVSLAVRAGRRSPRALEPALQALYDRLAEAADR